MGEEDEKASPFGGWLPPLKGAAPPLAAVVGVVSLPLVGEVPAQRGIGFRKPLSLGYASPAPLRGAPRERGAVTAPL